MSIAELIARLGHHSTGLVIFLTCLPVMTYLYGKLISPVQALQRPHRYIYAGLIYLACVPGIFAAVLTAYSLFFIRANLLEVNFAIYFLPILSMGITVALIKNRVDLDELPGFDRLKGLMVLLTFTFIIVLFLIRFRIWLVFGGSLTALLVLGVAVFLLLRWSAARLFGKKRPV